MSHEISLITYLRFLSCWMNEKIKQRLETLDGTISLGDLKNEVSLMSIANEFPYLRSKGHHLQMDGLLNMMGMKQDVSLQLVLKSYVEIMKY